MTSTITDCKSTPWKEDETLFENIKKIVKKERILSAIGRGKSSEEDPRNETKKKEELKPRNPGNPVPSLQVNVSKAETLFAAKLTEMTDFKPAAPSRAK